MPTPARRAISLEEASSPWSAKTSRAACRSSCRLRSASARSSSQPLSLPSCFMLPILPSSGTTGPDRVHWKWIDWSTYAAPSSGPSRSTTEPVDHTETMEKEYVMQSDRPKKEKTQTMRAIILDDFDSSPGLRQDLPAPTPADNEVLVRGRDFAGVVEEVGSEVSGLSEGDEVFGFITGLSPTVHDGTWAELIAVPESVATRKPEGVDTASAGAAPLAAITALAAIDALGVSEGDTVLIVGANGGVGSFAVQLAANAGARVIAPALPEDEEYLKELGVSEILPREADIAALVHERYPEGIEALLDLVSYAPEGFDTHAEVLHDDGRGASSLSAAGEGSERHNVGAMPSPENLERLARLLEAGTLRVPIQQTYEFDQAPDALRALASEHTQGKRAIRVA